MTHAEFDKLMENRLEAVRQMRNTKGKEYALGEDRLANFEDIAREIGITPIQALMVFLDKHLRSIKSYVKNNQTFSTESIEGRITDAITYLVLLEGLIVDAREKT